MTRHHQRHPLGLLLPEPGAALDIREKKCDGSLFRHVVHVSSISQRRMLLRRYRAAERSAHRELAYASTHRACHHRNRVK